MCNISIIKALPFVLLFFLLPISTAGSNFSLALGVLLSMVFLSLDRKKNRLAFLKKQPFLIYCLFFCYLILSFILMGGLSATISDGLLKYQEIIFMPLLAYLISNQKDLTRFAVKAFLIAMGLTLLLSYLMGFGDIALFRHLDLGSFLNKLGDKSNPTIFKLHITHNFFMAFATLLWGYLAFYFWQTRKILATCFGFICLLGLFNIFFMVQGRTGYLVLFFAGLYFLIDKYRLRGFLVGMLAICLICLFLFSFSNNFYDRILEGADDLFSWNSSVSNYTSVGSRIEFIYQSLKIARDNLFFGIGVGNFGLAYATYTSLGFGMIQTENPHNQYILFLVETGLIGLGAFLYLNYICWNFSKHLSLFWMHATRIVLLSYGVANLFNSFLFDFSESLFFSAFMALAFSQLIHKKSEISS